MKTRKIVAMAMAGGGLVLGGLALNMQGASAHTGYVTPVCDSLTVHAQNYNTSHGKNHVKVVVDGKVKVDTDFSTGYDAKFSTDGKGYNWLVSVHASDDQRFSFTKSGHEAACQPKPCPTVTVTKYIEVPGPTVTKTKTETVTETVTAPPVTETQTVTANSTVTLPGKTVTKVNTVTIVKTQDSNGKIVKVQKFSQPTGNLAFTGGAGVWYIVFVESAALALILGGLLILVSGKGFRVVRSH